MNDANIKQSESLWSFANDLKTIAYQYSSEVSRIANETHDTCSNGLHMVSMMENALRRAEEATRYAEAAYSDYAYNSGENYDSSYAASLKEAIRIAKEYEEEVRRDYEKICRLMSSLQTYCATLYSKLAAEGGSIQSMADSTSQKILTEHTIISDYNSL